MRQRTRPLHQGQPPQVFNNLTEQSRALDLTDSMLLQVRCGRRPCLLPHAPPTAPAPPRPPRPPPGDLDLWSCPGGHECVEHQFLTCFSPPCHRWGVCSMPEPPTPLHTQCEPNSGYLDNSCARITLIFKKDKVPQVRGRSVWTFNTNLCACFTISHFY